MTSDPFRDLKHILLLYISEKSLINLKKRWNEKTRFYHNQNHLIHVLSNIVNNLWFSSLSRVEKHALLLAAFFHDAIYNPKKNDNEDKSIELFKICYKGYDSIMVQKVSELIETTKHRKKPIVGLQKIFWMADNGGFFENYDIFLKTENKIRKEYSHIPSNKYKEVRIKFLESNLGIFDNPKVDQNIKNLIEYIKKTY
jgi:predicted metal-dependent HD superfamily phosphohydrolase